MPSVEFPVTFRYNPSGYPWDCFFGMYHLYPQVLILFLAPVRNYPIRSLPHCPFSCAVMTLNCKLVLSSKYIESCFFVIPFTSRFLLLALQTISFCLKAHRWKAHLFTLLNRTQFQLTCCKHGRADRKRVNANPRLQMQIQMFLLLLLWVFWDCPISKQEAKQTSLQSYKTQTKILLILC